MTIKKMTLAAAMTVGLIAGGMNFAMADCGCSSPVITGGACPLDCPQVVTPQTAKCPKCKKEKKKCECVPKCDPCDDPCEKKSCTDCDKIDDCDCPSTSCAPDPVPACGVCANTLEDADKHKHQIYAYPHAIYGKDNVLVGEEKNGVILSDKAYTMATGCGCPTGAAIGVPVIRDCECATGAAMPCLNGVNSNVCGVPVERNSCNYDDATCPIQIETETSIEATKKSWVPFNYSSQMSATGAAAPVVSAFQDIPDGFWASCDINKLTENNVIAGYPDRTFKPNLPVTRAEFASMTVKGFNLNENVTCPNANFKDVPKNHWANKVINNSVANGLMTGYPHNLFKPNMPVTRAEALTILSKGVKCPMDECKAKEILKQYCDGDTVPAWAVISIAKALDAGALSDLPTTNQIMPNKDASRAELASMLEKIRISGGYTTRDVAVTPSPCGCTGGAAYMEKDEIVTIPTLQICFDDNISSRTAHVGDQFAAKTIDCVTVDGKEFAAGSIVRGKVLEVERPSNCDKGGLKLSFNSIENCDCKKDLPQQVLTAQVNKSHYPNPVARLIAWPFTTVGQIVGTAGRAVGGAAISVSNAFEEVTSGFGTATGELFQGKFKASGRSYQDTGKALVKAPIDLTRTALSGTLGMFQVTADEVSYLVDPKGVKVSSVNPREKVTISFGCNATTGAAAPCPCDCPNPCPKDCGCN